MSRFKGLINLKLAEMFDLPDAKQAVTLALRRSQSAIFRNVPLFYIEELKTRLRGKEVDISVNKGIDPPESLKSVARFYRNRQAVKVNYFNRRVEFGNIFLARIIFDVMWEGDEIFEISSISYHRCLACHERQDLWFDNGLKGGVIGEIVEIDIGWETILKQVAASSKVVINNIPDFLLDDLESILGGKETTILVPSKHRVPPKIARLPKTKIATRLIHTYTALEDGSHAHVGGIALPHIHYGVAWNDRLVSLRSVLWPTCIKCMVKAHLTNWSLGIRPRKIFR